MAKYETVKTYRELERKYRVGNDSWKKYLAMVAVLAVAASAYLLFYSQQAEDNNVKRFSSQEELDSFLKANTDSGYYGGGVMGVAETSAMQKSVSSDISQATSGEAGAPSSGGSVDYSQTNIQVAGVDEADIVKSDGKYIYAVSGNKVFILDAYPTEGAKILSTLDFNGSVSEIFINGDRLVVFGQESYQYATQKAVPASDISGGPGALPAAEKASTEAIMARSYYYYPSTFINIYDISDRNSPALARNASVGGSYYDSRMIGDYIYVIANQPVYSYGGGPVPLPIIRSNGVAREIPATDIYYFGVPDRSFIFTNIISVNAQTGDEVSSKTFLMGYSQSMYVSLNSIYITYQKRVSEIRIYERIIDEVIIPSVPQDVKNKIIEIRNYNISEPNKMDEIGKIFENYISSLNPEQAASAMKGVQDRLASLMNEITKEMEKTVVHKISVENGNIEYRTNGEVPGQPLNQFSMDESGGYFRIATTTSGNSGFFSGGIAGPSAGMTERSVQTSIAEDAASSGVGQAKTATQVSGKMAQSPPASPDISQEEQKKIQQIEMQTVPVKQAAPQVSGPLNHIYVMDGNLKIVGKVEDLAAGERIYSVRFMGDKAYMVTFRQTDPLFVIDLSSPQNPKVLGYLKVPGVSDYLHPYDETHIIGVGRDASDGGRIRGLKLALFDVSDFANPKEISKYIIGDRGTSSDALHDHKAFLFNKEKNLLVIPVSEYRQTPASDRPEWQWKNNYWQGAYVFNIDLANGIALKGKITHADESSKNISQMRVEGKFGNALQFDGGGNYVSVPDAASLDIGKSISISAWIMPNSISSDTAIVSKDNPWTNHGNYNLFVGGDGSLQFTYFPSGGYATYAYKTGAGAVTAGAWQHVAVSFDYENGSSMKMIVNGELRNGSWVSGDGNLPPTRTQGALALGAETTGKSWRFKGRIDDVRLYNVSLSLQDASAIFSGGEASSGGLVGWWKLDETGGESVADSSGSGNSGKITRYENNYYYDYASQIGRSLFIENVLYTLSQKMVKMNDLADLAEINRVEFPAQETGYPYRIY